MSEAPAVRRAGPGTATGGAGPRATRAWLPNQHGAWAMLAVPLLVGVAAGGFSPWQVVLAGAAVSGYLASATAQAWARSRRRGSLAPPATYGAVFVALGVALVATHPALLLTLMVLVPATLVVAAGARPGTRRDLANTLAQVAQATVLVPAAASLGPSADPATIAGSTAIVAAYLLGTVLVVRSVLRERGNGVFAAFSAGYHLALLGIAIVALPWPYAVLALGLAIRAAALPVLQGRWAGTDHPLRPVQVGMVELAAGIALVVVAFATL